MKIGRNEKCPCGSEKKFKYCCINRTSDDLELLKERNWFERVSKLPFRAEISSTDGQSSEMKIFSAQRFIDGVLVDDFKDEITLSLNKTPGDYSGQAKAILIVPPGRSTLADIHLTGNTSIENLNNKHRIALRDDVSEIKVKSDSGIFARITKVFRRDEGFECFDIIFGESGRLENITNGKKDRPHITLFPDGNGKYIRLASYKCSIEQHMTYEKNSKSIHPSSIIILLEEYTEKLKLNFTFLSDLVVLEDAKIVT